MITIVGSNKGGCGKTTTAVCVATALAQRGFDVCLVDADPQRSASRWCAEREDAQLKPSITLIEKRDNITQTLKTLGEKFDHVIVDVAGRNSRELISGAVVADLILAPHQCSQLDLDTLSELQDQVVRIRDINPALRVLVYHTMASTNPAVKDAERAEFRAYLAEYPEIQLLSASGFYRKAYKDCISLGKAAQEVGNELAASEIRELIEEAFNA